MKDEVFELLAPELLERYRRWRPRLTALQIVAVLLAIAGQVVGIIDGTNGAYNGDVAYALLYSGVLLWIVMLVADKYLTRGLSGMGALFSTRFRIILTGLWLVASMTGFATLDSVYNSWADQKARFQR